MHISISKLNYNFRGYALDHPSPMGFSQDAEAEMAYFRLQAIMPWATLHFLARSIATLAEQHCQADGGCSPSALGWVIQRPSQLEPMQLIPSWSSSLTSNSMTWATRVKCRKIGPFSFPSSLAVCY